jgi:hypothetical protein
MNSESLNTDLIFEIIKEKDPAQIPALMQIQQKAEQLCQVKASLQRSQNLLKESTDKRSVAYAKLQPLHSEEAALDSRSTSFDLLISVCLCIPLGVGLVALWGVSLRDFKGQYLALGISLIVAFGLTTAMKQTIYNATFTAAQRRKEKYNRQTAESTWQLFQDRNVWTIILIFVGLETAFDFLGLQQNVPPSFKENPVWQIALFGVSALPAVTNCFWAASTGDTDGTRQHKLNEIKASPKEQLLDDN